MRMVLATALVLSGIGSPARADAQVVTPDPNRWLVYHEGVGALFAYDVLTVREESEGVYRVWDRWSFSNITIYGLKGEPASARESLIVLDCNESRMMPIAARDFDARGVQTASVTMEDEKWTYVPPESIGEIALLKLCMALHARFAPEW